METGYGRKIKLKYNGELMLVFIERKFIILQIKSEKSTKKAALEDKILINTLTLT